MALRWTLAATEENGALFPDERVATRHVGKGAYTGLEFLHVNARTIINTVPPQSQMPFRHTINAYRGCSHACAYCTAGETPILMGDGTTKPMAEVLTGDLVYGTVRRGVYRRYVITEVLDHWSTVRHACRTTLEDGTQLITSGDHRFLTDRGWKHVTDTGWGAVQRAHLTVNNRLLGTGRFAAGPDHGPDYRRGYLCGMIRGDGTIGSYAYGPEGRDVVHRFRLALVDHQGLSRTEEYLKLAGISTRGRVFQKATAATKQMDAISNQTRSGVEAVRELIQWAPVASGEWVKGFLAGIFDAEGSHSRGILRIANTDPQILVRVTTALRRFGFDYAVEMSGRDNGLGYVRVRGGLSERLRFFHTVDPAISRKRSIDGEAFKSKTTTLKVVSVEPLGLELPLYDMTTGTGDFVSDGVISHNCFARPTHDYLGLNIGEDFEKRIVVKINAVERLRAELRAPKWHGEAIAMGTNTDPYQHAEGKYHLTQGIIDVLSEAQNPFSILTKSTLILRDTAALVKAVARTDVTVNFSVGTLDRSVWKLTEPGTPPPDKRLEALRRLAEAGISCGVLVAPVLPGLSDSDDQLRAVTEAAAAAGAISVSGVALHLRGPMREHYLNWLADVRPDLSALYRARFRSGAYQDESERDRIGEIVKATARRSGVTGRRGRLIPDAPAPAAATPEKTASSEQLSLL
jgi:DNA repair photolyase